MHSDSRPAAHGSNPVFETVAQGAARLRAELRRHLHGKARVTDRLLAALLAGGHVLIEDVPGVGKTTIANCFARALGASFKRIQFTSDTLPGDVLGVSVYQNADAGFRFLPGPVFANVVLADEINRSPARTQSALLEAMERPFISVDGDSHPLPAPFIVIATQNPVDFDSTYPLPVAQLDRFALRLSVGYPDKDEEIALLAGAENHYDALGIQAVLDLAEVRQAQGAVRHIHVEPALLEYLHTVADATRRRADLAYGISPRGLLTWKLLAQASALLAGRRFVTPEDLAGVAVETLAHRIRLRGEEIAQSSWQGAAAVIREVLARVPPPHVREARAHA